MDYRVGSKGQVVIAKRIRDRLGVEPGWVAVQKVVRDHMEIYFVPPSHRRSLKGVLGPHVKSTEVPGAEGAKETERAWAQAEKEGHEGDG